MREIQFPINNEQLRMNDHLDYLKQKGGSKNRQNYTLYILHF